MREISKEEMEEWRLHPVTKALLDHLQQERESLKEQWACDQFAAEDGKTTDLVNAHARGICRAYAKVINIETGDLNEQPDRIEAIGERGTGQGR